MPEAKVVMDPVQKEAFDILFGGIEKVELVPQNGGVQDRIADPMGKIASCFPSHEEAKSFIVKLDGLGGLILDVLPCGAIRVSASRWLEVSYMIEVVPGPSCRPASVPSEKPFGREEAEIIAKRDAEESRQSELREKRIELARLLDATDAAIAESIAKVAGLDELLVKARSFREQWGKFFPEAHVVQEAAQ